MKPKPNPPKPSELSTPQLLKLLQYDFKRIMLKSFRGERRTYLNCVRVSDSSSGILKLTWTNPFLLVFFLSLY